MVYQKTVKIAKFEGIKILSMNILDQNIKLSQAQIYLLKNLAVLSDVPITAKQLFEFLSIDQQMHLQYFDALHSLVPEWLEYKNSYYIFHKEKVKKFIRYYPIRVNDLYLLINYLKKIYYNVNYNNIKLLERYEPYILSILKNFKQPSILLSQLFLAYAQFLSYKENYQEALLTIQQAVSYLQQQNNASAILVQAYTEMSFIYLKINNLEKALQLALKAKEILAKIHRTIPRIEINLEFLLGEISFKYKEFSQAIHHYLQVINKLNNKKIEQPRLLLYIYLQLSNAFKYQGKYEKSLHYIFLAEKSLSFLTEPEKKIFGEQIKLQKKGILGLSVLNKFKTKFLLYTFLAIAMLFSLLTILIFLKTLFK